MSAQSSQELGADILRGNVKELTHVNASDSFVIRQFDRRQKFSCNRQQGILWPWLE